MEHNGIHARLAAAGFALAAIGCGAGPEDFRDTTTHTPTGHGSAALGEVLRPAGSRSAGQSGAASCGEGSCSVPLGELCAPSDEPVCVLQTSEPRCGDAGNRDEGDTCTHVAACAADAACFREEVTEGAAADEAQCRSICCPFATSPDEGCPADTVCRGSGVLVDGTTTAWGACLEARTCDPVAPQCGAGEMCTLFADEWQCRTAGWAAVGDACNSSLECQSGALCRGVSEENRRCVRLCDLTDTQACDAAGWLCQPLELTQSGSSVGLCVDPIDGAGTLPGWG